MEANANSLICHLTPCTETSMVASTRIARFLSHTLGIPLVDRPGMAYFNRDFGRYPLDVFFLVNSPTGFASPEMREWAAYASYFAKHAVFVQNDYKMRPPSQMKSWALRKGLPSPGESKNYYGMSRWSTVTNELRAVEPWDRYINWNALTFTKGAVAPKMTDREHRFLYWGALRQERVPKFRQYFTKELFPTISTAKQSWVKFQDALAISPNVKFIPQCKQLSETLQMVQCTVYLQDPYSDAHFTSPANRFYEAISAGVVCFIDADAVSQLERLGLKVPSQLVVHGPQDILDRQPHLQKLQDLQSQVWCRTDYRANLAHQVTQTWERCLKGEP